MFIQVILFTSIAILISGNDSVYPGETATLTCHVNTIGIDLVTFQWVRTDGENVIFFNESVDVETSGGDSNLTIAFNSTFNVTNVNYTDNNFGYYCNASGCNISMIAYLTGTVAINKLCNAGRIYVFLRVGAGICTYTE